jgi:hypothetical protein
MKRSLLILIAVLALGLVANFAIAKTGGVKVDDNGDPCDGTQSNVLTCGSTAYIDINASGNNFDSSVTCQVCTTGTNQKGNNQNCVSLDCSSVTSTSCSNGNTYYIYSFTVPYNTGVNTVVVNNAAGNVGADSFRVSCD